MSESHIGNRWTTNDHTCVHETPTTARPHQGWTELERALHRDLVAAKRDLAVAIARAETNLRPKYAAEAPGLSPENYAAGLARMPEIRRDNSVAHLDVDLLCDDA